MVKTVQEELLKLKFEPHFKGLPADKICTINWETKERTPITHCKALLVKPKPACNPHFGRYLANEVMV